ncbi:MAG: methyltransferase domain-containing protein [Tessaracoccus sp.]|uniref:class I SAM-dependent methyltransferase n=1 Tax=Tessaracoccus sp. TaxID=1971211 RepID=UPI001EBFDE31|nr:class I SAM-dependent methyltransferase [Tessaracoccus sp.]MBK7819859.1 methyltransferase domain-containing protein [Tessaracoccus sp.]
MSEQTPVTQPGRGPGAMEAVLSRSFGGEHTPYEWLARSVSSSAKTVLDLACGAGAMVDRLARPGRTVIGLDRAIEELEEARRRGRGPLVQAHASYLPFADNSFDAVVTSLGIAVVADRPRFLAEAARVLRPGGVFAALTPSLRPTNVDDLKLISRLLGALRVAPHLPGITEFKAKPAFTAVGLTKAEDKRARYYYEVASEEDALRLLDGLRAPIDAARGAAAIEYLRGRLADGPIRVPLPMRRLIAIK